jgi:hypothetical protein
MSREALETAAAAHNLSTEKISLTGKAGLLAPATLQIFPPPRPEVTERAFLTHAFINQRQR